MRTLPCLLLLLGVVSIRIGAEQIPACMLNYRHGPEQHFLIVEKSSHSLFVYSNQSSEPLTRFRVTTGKRIGQKQVEGDSKTPEGIYFFTRIISGPDLPKSDDYGEKAFVTDYPNPIDEKENRKGSGIWLHGAHDPDKTATPNNSRGCVVMQNDDLTRVSKYIYLNQTPLCIYETIPYLTEAEITQNRDQVLGLLSHWKQSWEEKDSSGYLSHYADDFSTDGLSREAFRRHKETLNRQYRYMRIFLNNLTLFGYDRYVVARFNQVYISDKNHFHSHKTQYWQQQGSGHLAIRAETSRQLSPIQQIEVDKGNWVSLNQFRLITEKKIQNQSLASPPIQDEPALPPPAAQTIPPLKPQSPVVTEHRYPGLQSLKTIRDSDKRLDCELTFSSRTPDWRFIPVLAVISEGTTTYTSLNGIRLRDGIPANPELGKLLTSLDQTVQFDLPAGAQVRSITVFIIDPDNQIRQVVTSFFAP
jgi:murein L,D-transpeptidase YafK